MGAPPPGLPVHLQPASSAGRVGRGSVAPQLCSAPPSAKRSPKVQKGWVHPASPVGRCATEGLSWGQPDLQAFLHPTWAKAFAQSWVRSVSGPLARPACPLGSGAGLSDNKCLFSRAGGGGVNRTSWRFPPARCCSGSHSPGTGDITSLSSALASLPPPPLHPML